MVVLTQGCGCRAAFTLGFAAPRFQRWIDSLAIQGRNFESHFRLHPTRSAQALLPVKVSVPKIGYRLQVTSCRLKTSNWAIPNLKLVTCNPHFHASLSAPQARDGLFRKHVIRRLIDRSKLSARAYININLDLRHRCANRIILESEI
jgi:hypothetical protein